MNKVYNVVWSKSLGQWVVASEISRSRGKSAAKATLIAGIMAFAANAQAAECYGVVNSYASDSSGTACTVSGTNYNYVHASNGTPVTVSNPITIYATSSSTAAVLVSTNANIHFMGNTKVGATGQRHGVAISQGSIVVDGNLDASAVGSSGRAVFVDGVGSSLTINGNFTGTRTNKVQGAVAEVTAGNTINVTGTTTLNGNGTDGMRLGGIATLGGDVSITVNNYTHGVLNSGSSKFDGNLTVNTTNMWNGGIVNTNSGSIAVAKDLNVTTSGTTANSYGVNNAGSIAVTGGTTIKTSSEGSHGINNTAGTLTLGGSSVLTTTGVDAIGVNTTGGSTIFNQLTANTSGANAVGIAVTGAGATTTLGSGSTITTTGDGATGVSVTDGTLNFASGEVKTSGANAAGISVTNPLPASFTTAANVTTTGASSDGMRLDNVPTAIINSNISASGTDSSGILYDGQETASLTTGGNITAAYMGISADASGDLVVNTAAGKTIASGGDGISVVKSQYGTSTTTLNNNSTINSSGTHGIAVAAYYGGAITINNTADVTATGTSGLSSNATCLNKGTAGISAGSCNLGGEINIASSGKVTSSNGILAKVSGDFTPANSNNITINVSGDVIATDGVGISAKSDIGKIDITTASSATIQATGDAINVTSGGDIAVTNAATLISLDGNGITTESNPGSFIVNSGDITATTAGKFVIVGGEAVETVTTTAGTLKGNIYLDAGNDSFTASGGALVGNTLMGGGDDVATLTGTVDVTSAPQFDGDTDTDVLNVDGLTLRGFTAASNDGTGNLTETNNSNLTGWETINVKNAGTLKLSNNLFTAANVGTLNIDASSKLDLKGNSPGVFTIFGNVNNSGIMTQADGAADDVTTITGNYTGVAGSQYNIDTVLGNDASATDKLIVNGNTSGATTLSVTNVGGTGAQTVEGIQVVQVDGTSDGSFTLAAPVQAGSYEYTLQKNGVSTPTDGDWYLRSTFIATCANTPSLCPVTEPPVRVYRPAVAMYVTAQSANADAGFLQLSTLHQRMSEQRALSTDKAQTWGRLFTTSQSNNGQNRFDYDQHTTGFQFGHDLRHTTDEQGKQQRAGLTVQYAHSNIDSKDTIRPLLGLGKDSGSTSATSVGIGGYFTQIAKDGAYIDIVSQVNHLTNKFSDSYGLKSKQHGWQIGLSGEIGKPVAQVKDWHIEPQAQLSYLYSRYSGFSDLYSNIAGVNAHNLRARLGLRVYKDVVIDNKDAQYYGIVNIHHDLLKPKTITLYDRTGTGQASVSERFDRTSWEVGAGIQGQVGKNTYLYADARYERSFKGNKEAGQINLGVKASF